MVTMFGRWNQLWPTCTSCEKSLNNKLKWVSQINTNQWAQREEFALDAVAAMLLCLRQHQGFRLSHKIGSDDERYLNKFSIIFKFYPQSVSRLNKEAAWANLDACLKKDLVCIFRSAPCCDTKTGQVAQTARTIWKPF